MLNIAEDHVDWHGSFDRYKADKARCAEHQVACIFNTDHADTLRMVEEADVEGARAIGFSATQMPAVSMLGLAEHHRGPGLPEEPLQRGARAGRRAGFAPAPRGKMPAQYTVENALAAAALCRAADVDPKAVGAGLRSFKTGAHRNQLVGTLMTSCGERLEGHEPARGQRLDERLPSLVDCRWPVEGRGVRRADYRSR